MAHVVVPRLVERSGGSCRIPTRCTIASIHAEDRIPARQLVDELARLGCAAKLTQETGNALIVIRRKRSIPHREGYELVVTDGGIVISAPSAAGAYYGVQTLRELIRSEGTTLAARTIHDHPDFARRGYYLDCSRGKVPQIDTIRELVEWLAHWKINELQLYVENVFTFASHPRIGEGFSPFTPEDIRAVQEHCRLHHVQLVPSLTSLGHFEKILMLPEYQDLGELAGYSDLPGGTTLNPLDPRSVALLSDMYGEFLPLFDAVDFNACGDEPWELGQGRSKEKAEAQGAGRVYLDFMLEARRLSIENGKRMNMWGDIVLKHPEIIPELPPEIVLLNWDYSPDGDMLTRTGEFAAAGLPLVCCPGTHGWQSHGTRLETSTKNIHQFAGIALEFGAEGILNTDWGDAGHRNTLGASLHGAAYGAACAWNFAGTPGPGSDDFTRAFVRDLFDDADGALVPYLRTIGDDDFGYWAYHTLIESLGEARGFGNGFAQGRAMVERVELSDSTLLEKIDVATSLVDSGVPVSSHKVGSHEVSAHEAMPAFAAVALEEYALANRMNREAARRVVFARKVRDGGGLSPSQIAAHRDELAGIRDELERLWMVRNRVSRLADSLAGFDQAIEELGGL